MAQFFKNIAKNVRESLEGMPVVIGIFASIGYAGGIIVMFVKILATTEGSFWGPLLAFAACVVALWIYYIVVNAIVDTCYERRQERMRKEVEN